MTTPAPEAPITPAPETPPAPKGESVSREAYEKTLAEKRNFAEKAKTLEAELEKIKTAQLKEKEDFKSMYEMAAKKAQDLETQIQAVEAEKTRSIKLTQVKREWEKLGLKDSKTADGLLKLIDLEKVKYDSDLKIVLGHEEEAKRVFEDFKPLFAGETPRADHSAPKGTPVSISVEGYKQALKDGSFNKMSKEEQKSYLAKVYESQGVTVRK
jgi:hypothetical protein